LKAGKLIGVWAKDKGDQMPGQIARIMFASDGGYSRWDMDGREERGEFKVEGQSVNVTRRGFGFPDTHTVLMLTDRTLIWTNGPATVEEFTRER
jgi:hypothetical protein